jgi:hypothetical protein
MEDVVQSPDQLRRTVFRHDAGRRGVTHDIGEHRVVVVAGQ